MPRHAIKVHTLGISSSELLVIVNKVALAFPQLNLIIYSDEETGAGLVLSIEQKKRALADDLEQCQNTIRQVLKDRIWGVNNETLSEVVGKMLADFDLALSTAESCTGGLLASLITDVHGSSQFFHQGYVTYSNAAKMSLLGVSKKTLDTHGAVSKACVREMIEGLLERTTADYVLATSGYVDPDTQGTEKEPGLVFIGTGSRHKINIQAFRFTADRKTNKLMAASHALNLLRLMLLKDSRKDILQTKQPANKPAKSENRLP
ncbi:MAG: CinA family protein [Gammaproteobacteria bacterium]|nr:CinA family protein [Gammaproteobacteria bacterium]